MAKVKVLMDKKMCEELRQANIRIRTRYDMTQKEFGRRIGYQGSTVSCIERGKYPPQNKYLRAVSSNFNLLPSEVKTIENAIWIMENPEATPKMVEKHSGNSEEVRKLKEDLEKMGKENALLKRRLRDIKHVLKAKLI